MIYPVKIPGFENQNIEVKPGIVFTGPKLLVNGQPAPKGKGRGEMLLRRDDGSEVVATWKSQFIGLDVPKLIVDKKEIQVVEALKWYEYIWIGLPALLVLLGVVGALLGIVGFVINASIFRSSKSRFMKFILTAAVTILTVAIYIVAGIIFSAILEMACPR